MTLTVTDDVRAACVQAADLLANQAEGLRLTGSTSTVAGLRDYVETLRRIAANTAVSLTDKDKVDVEQSTFVLEGLRDGLMTAEFRDRAEKVNDTIRALNRLVEAYNAAGGA